MEKTGDYYNLASVVFDGVEVNVDGFKTTDKLEAKDFTSSNEHIPYGTIFGKESHEFEISDIDPNRRHLFERMIRRHELNPNDLISIESYVFNEKSRHIKIKDYYEGYVTEIVGDNANLPFSVKGKARRMVIPNKR